VTAPDAPLPAPTPRHLSLDKAFTNTEWLTVKALLIAAIAIEDPDEKVSILDAALDRAWSHGRSAGFRAGIESTAKVLAAADDLSLAWNDHSRSEDNMGIEITALCAAITAFRALSPDADMGESGRPRGSVRSGGEDATGGGQC